MVMLSDRKVYPQKHKSPEEYYLQQKKQRQSSRLRQKNFTEKFEIKRDTRPRRKNNVNLIIFQSDNLKERLDDSQNLAELSF